MGGDVPYESRDSGSGNDEMQVQELLSQAGWKYEQQDSSPAAIQHNFGKEALESWAQTRKALEDPDNALAMIPGEGFILAVGSKLINAERFIARLRKAVGFVERTVKEGEADEAPSAVPDSKTTQSYDLQRPFKLTSGPFKGAKVTRVAHNEAGEVTVENTEGLFGEGTAKSATQKTNGDLVFKYNPPRLNGGLAVTKETHTPDGQYIFENPEGQLHNDGGKLMRIIENKTGRVYEYNKSKLAPDAPVRVTEQIDKTMILEFEPAVKLPHGEQAAKIVFNNDGSQIITTDTGAEFYEPPEFPTPRTMH